MQYRLLLYIFNTFSSYSNLCFFFKNALTLICIPICLQRMLDNHRITQIIEYFVWNRTCQKTHYKIPVLFRPPLYRLHLHTADKRITHDPCKREFGKYTIVIHIYIYTDAIKIISYILLYKNWDS